MAATNLELVRRWHDRCLMVGSGCRECALEHDCIQLFPGFQEYAVSSDAKNRATNQKEASALAARVKPPEAQLAAVGGLISGHTYNIKERKRYKRDCVLLSPTTASVAVGKSASKKKPNKKKPCKLLFKEESVRQINVALCCLTGTKKEVDLLYTPESRRLDIVFCTTGKYHYKSRRCDRKNATQFDSAYIHCRGLFKKNRMLCKHLKEAGPREFPLLPDGSDRLRFFALIKSDEEKDKKIF